MTFDGIEIEAEPGGFYLKVGSFGLYLPVADAVLVRLFLTKCLEHDRYKFPNFRANYRTHKGASIVCRNFCFYFIFKDPQLEKWTNYKFSPASAAMLADFLQAGSIELFNTEKLKKGLQKEPGKAKSEVSIDFEEQQFNIKPDLTKPYSVDSYKRGIKPVCRNGAIPTAVELFAAPRGHFCFSAVVDGILSTFTESGRYLPERDFYLDLFEPLLPASINKSVDSETSESKGTKLYIAVGDIRSAYSDSFYTTRAYFTRQEAGAAAANLQMETTFKIVEVTI